MWYVASRVDDLSSVCCLIYVDPTTQQQYRDKGNQGFKSEETDCPVESKDSCLQFTVLRLSSHLIRIWCWIMYIKNSRCMIRRGVRDNCTKRSVSMFAIGQTSRKNWRKVCITVRPSEQEMLNIINYTTQVGYNCTMVHRLGASAANFCSSGIECDEHIITHTDTHIQRCPR